MSRAKLNAADLRALLRKRYEPDQGWVLISEVSDGTGASHNRSADALALQTWPSRGIELHGFEIKVSRSDLVRELREPEKAEPFRKRCHRWWLVLADKALAEGVEIPATWGILAPTNGVLRASRDAPSQDPGLLEWGPFLASVIRSAHRQAPEIEKIEAARADGEARGKASAGYAIEREAKLEAIINAFDKGLNDTYRMLYSSTERAEELGKACRLGLSGDVARKAREHAERVATGLERVVAEIRGALT